MRQKLAISIHALLAESDALPPTDGLFFFDFYPRSPCGERRQQPDGTTKTAYFYPRSPCGERPEKGYTFKRIDKFLSTLSLRRATRYLKYPATSQVFLSTLSLRRATVALRTRSAQDSHFYPRSPCGERLHRALLIVAGGKFLSTLSLRRATSRFASWTGSQVFLSTLSLRRATLASLQFILRHKISIHALLAESDFIPAATG